MHTIDTSPYQIQRNQFSIYGLCDHKIYVLRKILTCDAEVLTAIGGLLNRCRWQHTLTVEEGAGQRCSMLQDKGTSSCLADLAISRTSALVNVRRNVDASDFGSIRAISDASTMAARNERGVFVDTTLAFTTPSVSSFESKSKPGLISQ